MAHMGFVGLLGNRTCRSDGGAPAPAAKPQNAAPSGPGPFDRLINVGSSVQDAASNLLGLERSDLPGGFNLGRSAILTRSSMSGANGFAMQSIPDGTQFFVAEQFGALHCCCCWAGRGPTYHVIEGRLEDGDEQIQMQSSSLCCCIAPEMDVVTMDGDVFASVDEQASCCCFADTRVAVRDSERYRVSGSLFGACCPCLRAQHKVEGRSDETVGRIVHRGGGAQIDFPEGAMASDKAALLAAMLMTDLRKR